MSDEEIKSPELSAEETEKIKEIQPELEEDIIEFEYNEDGEEDIKKTLKKLRADLKITKKDKEEYLTGWQKERADFLNYKKGEDDRRAMISESLRERVLSSFLSVADSFNMAFANREAWEKVDKNWRTGVEYIYTQLNTCFEEYGVQSFGEAGDSFDPALHNPVEMTETNEKEKDHKISLIIQKGYKMGERVLRPARVNVFEYKNKE